MNKYMSTFKRNNYLILSFIFIISLFLNISSPIHAVTHKHTKTHHHKHVNKNVILGVVKLTPKPSTNLEALARRLNQSDISFSAQHSDQPLILIGYTNLSSTKTARMVLFTQLQSATLCGSAGCSTTAYVKKNNHWIKVLDSVTGDIEIKETTHHEMHDLLVSSSDLWIWNGKTYIESQQGPNVKGLKQSIKQYQKTHR